MDHGVAEATALKPRRPEPHWGELFDFVANPGEHRNLFNDSAHRARRDRRDERFVSRFPARPDVATALIAKW